MEKRGETKPASVTVTQTVSSEQNFQRIKSTVTGPVAASLQSSRRKHGAQEAVGAETQKGRPHGARIPFLLRTCLSAPLLS